MPKVPEDHKPAGGGYTFVAGGKTYTIPPLTDEVAESVPGHITYDAVMNPDDLEVQVRLAFAQIEAAKLKPAVKSALLSLPTGEMMTAVSGWLGESSGSSTT